MNRELCPILAHKTMIIFRCIVYSHTIMKTSTPGLDARVVKSLIRLKERDSCNPAVTKNSGQRHLIAA